MSLGYKIYVVSILSLILFGCLIWVINIDKERAAHSQKEQEAKVEYISQAPASAGETARVAPVDGRRLFLDNCSGCHEVNPYAAPSGMNIAGVGSRMSKAVLRALMTDPPPPMEPWAGSDEELEALLDYMASLTTGRSYLAIDIIPIHPEQALPGHLGGKAGYDVYITRCSICHQINIDAAGGGLNLAGLGARLDEDTIRLVIANPHAGMPEWTGSKEELGSLVQFLTGLTESAGTMPGYIGVALDAEGISGASLIQKYNCESCHPLTPGKPLTLAGVGSRFNRAKIKEKVTEMPGWGGDDDELDTITDYLLALDGDEGTGAQAEEVEGVEEEEPIEKEEPAPVTIKVDGKEFFSANCMICHETEGTGGGLNLAGVGDRLGASGIRGKIVTPPASMPSWMGTDDELDAVIFYLMGLKSSPPEEEPAKPEKEEAKEEPPPEKAGGDSAKGKEYYETHCGFCHETTGTGGGLNLTGVSSRLSTTEIKDKIANPPEGMTDWTGTEDELKDVIAYLLSL